MTQYYWSDPKEKQLELSFEHKGAERTAALIALLCLIVLGPFVWLKSLFTRV